MGRAGADEEAQADEIDGLVSGLLSMVGIDYDDRDLREGAPDRGVSELPEAPIAKATWFRDARSAIVEHLQSERTVTVRRNPELELWSRPGESSEGFAARCQAAGEQTSPPRSRRSRSGWRRPTSTSASWC